VRNHNGFENGKDHGYYKRNRKERLETWCEVDEGIVDRDGAGCGKEETGWE
jgi:hypothetical protein